MGDPTGFIKHTRQAPKYLPFDERLKNHEEHIEILADHQTLRSTYGAILVDAGAFQFQSGGSPMTGWFLTIVLQQYDSKEEAQQFCTDNGLGGNVCLAREFKPPNP